MADEFGWSPSYGSGGSVTPAVSEAQYGDGYSQRVAAGINSIGRQFPVQFNNRTTSEIEAIDAFLSSKNGTDYFLWTPPGKAQIKVICKEWSFTWRGYDKTGLSATFKQVFDP